MGPGTNHAPTHLLLELPRKGNAMGFSYERAYNKQ